MRDEAALERVVTRLRERQPQALGVALDLRTRSGTRLRSGDDARRSTLAGLAVALPQQSEREPAAVVVVAGALADAALAQLAELAQAEPAPYLVFADAQRCLHRFAAAGLAQPRRFGCATVAATLLAEGSDGRRDQRPLEGSVRTWLDRELPEVLLGAVTTQRLASEAEALLALLAELTPQLRQRGLARLYSFECGLVPAVVAMERAGFGIDPARFEAIASDWVRERNQLEGSQPERQARLDKLVSTYRWWARDFVDPDHRIRCRLHPLATDTGRFSCSEPNLQQVPGEHTAPGLRACFVPAPEHKLVIADYAQIELRVAAQLAPCEALRAVFRAGRDPHRATAANLTGKPEAAIDSHERKLAKAVNFGFLFGMGARRFRQYARDSYGVELDEREAGEAREAFLRTFPGIAAWHRRVGALSRRGRHESISVRTAMGRRKRFLPGKFAYNAALNIPVQGTAAEGFKLALPRLQAGLAELGGRGVLIVHDEYIAEVPAAQAEAARERVEAIMVAAMAELVDAVPIVVEAEIADHWK